MAEPTRRPVWVRAGLGVAAAAIAATGALAAASGADGSEPPPAPPPPVSLHVVGTDGSVPGGTVPFDTPLKITVTHATIQQVQVTGPDDTTLPGAVAPNQLSWTSASTLRPVAGYHVAVRARNLAGETVGREVDVTTTDTDKHLHVTLDPGDDAVVGVGMPVIFRFDRNIPVARRHALEKHLRVSTSTGLPGDWSWVSAHELHWVPVHFWTPGTRIHAIADLRGFHLAGRVWGAGAHDTRYTIGPRQVSVVDLAAHTMTVYRDGVVLRRVPMSAGRAKYPTMGGVHIVLDKARQVVMDSATVGIPRDAPDGYYEKVKWDVRISDSGEYVHAAPWSRSAQGRRNVSHGCINLSTRNAQWFYDLARRGDVVKVVHAARPPSRWDHGTADWN